MIFLLTPHLLLKQADITNATNFHKPFLFQLKTDLDLPAATAAEGEESGENEVRVLFLIPTHSRRKLIINYLYSATPTGRHPAHVRVDEELS